MDMVKKYGIKALSALALISLLLPMGSISMSSEYSQSCNGFHVIADNLFCFLLIILPFAIIMADYVGLMKKFRALMQVGCAGIGVIMTIVGYTQVSDAGLLGSLSGIASMMGSIEVETSIGFGTILGILAYAGVIAVIVMFQKEELKANIDALKGEKK